MVAVKEPKFPKKIFGKGTENVNMTYLCTTSLRCAITVALSNYTSETSMMELSAKTVNG